MVVFGRMKNVGFFYFMGVLRDRLHLYKDGHIFLCKLAELPWLKQFIVFIGLNDFI